MPNEYYEFSDDRTYEQIEKLVRWAQQDEFWMPNILSMDALRKKFDQLEMKADAKGLKRTASTTLPATYVPASERIRQERLAGGMQ